MERHIVAADDKKQQASEPLESWKAIANYLQRRVRTVQRWERDEGLPVHRHRHKKQATVYAYPHELETWRAGRDEQPAVQKTATNSPRALVVGVVLIALATLTYVLQKDNDSSEAIGTRAMLVVLPFNDLSADQTLGLLGDGLTEELSTQVAKIDADRIGVIARTSAMSFKNKQIPVDKIGEQLGVDYVLEGSIRQEGDRIRVTAQLIETETQSHVWAEDYDIRSSSWLDLQETATQNIARDLHLVFEIPIGEELEFDDRNENAYEQLLLGQHYFDNWGRSQIPQAIEHFGRAIKIDDEYVDAYVGLALSYGVLTFFGGLPPLEGYPKVRAAAETALELDQQNGEAHALIGWVKFIYDWDWGSAEERFLRGMELSPNSPWVHTLYGNYLSAMDRGGPAVEEMRIANRLDPLSPYTIIMLGYILESSGYHEEAVEKLEHANELFAGRPAQGFLVSAHEYAKDFDSAIAETAKRNPEQAAILSESFMRDGEQGYWQAKVDRLKSLREDRPDVFDMYSVHALSNHGSIDGAIEMLEKGYHQRNGAMAFLLTYPLDELHSDPRFQDLLRRMNLQLPADKAGSE